MKKPQSEYYPYYVSLIDALAAEAVPIQNSQMFGMPSAKMNGKAVAGLTGDDLIVKLTGDAHAAALSVPGATLFDPMGGRPMKQWVQIPVAQKDRWPEMLRLAVECFDGS